MDTNKIASIIALSLAGGILALPLIHPVKKNLQRNGLRTAVRHVKRHAKKAVRRVGAKVGVRVRSAVRKEFAPPPPPARKKARSPEVERRHKAEVAKWLTKMQTAAENDVQKSLQAGRGIDNVVRDVMWETQSSRLLAGKLPTRLHRSIGDLEKAYKWAWYEMSRDAKLTDLIENRRRKGATCHDKASRSDYLFPDEERYPVPTKACARTALTYASWPSNIYDAPGVVKRLWEKHPEWRFDHKLRSQAKRLLTKYERETGKAAKVAA